MTSESSSASGLGATPPEPLGGLPSTIGRRETNRRLACGDAGPLAMTRDGGRNRRCPRMKSFDQIRDRNDSAVGER
jgi:hypothetical protein